MRRATPHQVTWANATLLAAAVALAPDALAQPGSDPNPDDEWLESEPDEGPGESASTDPADESSGSAAAGDDGGGSENEKPEASRPVPAPPPPGGAEDAPKPKAEAEPPPSRSAREPKPDDEPSDPGPPTLLGGRKLTVGGYGGVAIKYTRIADTHALLVGGEGAVLIAHTLALGGAGYGLTTIVRGPLTEEGDRTRLHFGYGGPVIRFNFMQDGPVYLSVGGLIGAGGFALVREDYPGDVDIEESDVESNAFFVAEPQLSAHANLTRFMRIGLDVSYRFTYGVTLRGYRDGDFRGLAAGAHVQFGWF